MEFKDYYAALAVGRDATQEEIKRSYRKLARKYHPDVSKEPDAEARFKEVAEAYEVLKDPEKRAAYDELGQRYQRGQPFQPPPDFGSGFEFSGSDAAGPGDADFSDFFASLFGRHASAAARHRGAAAGGDHHAKVAITIEDAYRGARRSLSLRMPTLQSDGRMAMHERQIEVSIPKGIREGQHLRLAGQGEPGTGGAPAGDLYLEIAFQPHPKFRVDGRDVYTDLAVSPWEAALGSQVVLSTPEDKVKLSIPAASAAGRKLRLKGRGLPGSPPGDLYAVLKVVLPPADTPAASAAYQTLAQAFPGFDPRAVTEERA